MGPKPYLIFKAPIVTQRPMDHQDRLDLAGLLRVVPKSENSTEIKCLATSRLTSNLVYTHLDFYGLQVIWVHLVGFWCNGSQLLYFQNLGRAPCQSLKHPEKPLKLYARTGGTLQCPNPKHVNSNLLLSPKEEF